MSTLVLFTLAGLAGLAGVAIGLARGGHPASVLGLRPRASALVTLVVGIGFVGVADLADIPGRTAVATSGHLLILLGLLAHHHVRGAMVVAAGVALNLVVLVLNGRVPIRYEALVEAGIVSSDVSRTDVASVSGLRELETSESRLAVLGDVIPVGWLDTVISFGDLVVLAGIVVVVQAAVAARRAIGLSVDDLLGPTARSLEPAPLDLREPDWVPPELTPTGVRRPSTVLGDDDGLDLRPLEPSHRPPPDPERSQRGPVTAGR